MAGCGRGTEKEGKEVADDSTTYYYCCSGVPCVTADGSRKSRSIIHDECHCVCKKKNTYYCRCTTLTINTAAVL